MAMIHLTVVTPKGLMLDEDVQRVVVRTTGGDVCILPHHIDYAAALGEGEARVTLADGTVRRAQVRGGMLHFASEVAQVISSHFDWKEPAV